VIEDIRAGEQTVMTVGTAARPYVVAVLYAALNRPIFIITPNAERARRTVANARAFGTPAELFPDVETMPYDSLSPSAAAIGRRFAVLESIEAGTPGVWVAPVQAALRTIPPAYEGVHRSRSLRAGDEIDFYKLADVLVAMGYVRVPLVEDNGQFSLRGGIIDIFPSHMDEPVRVELFGDEIDSIRPFSASTQRSNGGLKEVKLYGCRQVALTDITVARASKTLPEDVPEWLADEIGRIKDKQHFEGIDKYLPFFYEASETVTDYIPRKAIIIIDEPEEAFQHAGHYLEQQLAYIDHLVEHGAMVKPVRSYFADPSDVRARVAVELTSIGSDSDRFVCKAAPIQHTSGAKLTELLAGYLGRGMTTVVSCVDDGQCNKLAQSLARENVDFSRDFKPGAKRVSLLTGNLQSGFESSDLNLAVIAIADIYRHASVSTKRKPAEKGTAISSIAELAIGDYVVHSAHGIAVYAGLQRREVAGVIRDYALLEYAGSDRLFVPTDQLDRITKYIGAAGETPPVSRLGSADWLKAKKKAKASVKKVAYDLLSLYATRAQVKGTAFSPDTPWQQELEDSFIYDETPDQLMAIEDVKSDMETDRPMDRLICGDVGYGKTEVAVRAAFKAIADGKQVMVLVPTTILAQQHYSTFSERLSAFPVSVEMVSRFKTAAQQKDIITRFNEGKVDVLIGTHRLLSSDVKPLDLGLIIIDEEQRFGVNDKEKLRAYKQSVDVLALSATPIPRTLQMSLAGVRDMSTIETPPEGRTPIVTHVGQYDEDMLIAAIRRELGRGGQVYYVHNRVESIDRVARRVNELIPDARVGVAHGQMSEHQLEKVMMTFLKREYDVLVCTTIIESGIDIPSVNTLIVDHAEILGLAQLYQLRGRVGRTKERAYAYFFYSPQRVLTMQAFERLKTISDFTALGSGIKIALRDLEIRGAGSLLGAEQHGHMSSVGFELYCQMLKEAIDEFEGKPVVDPTEIKIDIPVSAYVPDAYITEESLRIEAYKKVILANDMSDIEQIGIELSDRYGARPEPTERLLDIAKLRVLCKQSGISEITYQNKKLRIAPIAFARRQEVTLKSKYHTVSINTQRQYLSATLQEPAHIIPFLFRLFDDIMRALTTEVMVSQKAR
jgi:transcription-repair coupling factor (superfamily II helicase)